MIYTQRILSKKPVLFCLQNLSNRTGKRANLCIMHRCKTCPKLGSGQSCEHPRNSLSTLYHYFEADGSACSLLDYGLSVTEAPAHRIRHGKSRRGEEQEREPVYFGLFQSRSCLLSIGKRFLKMFDCTYLPSSGSWTDTRGPSYWAGPQETEKSPGSVSWQLLAAKEHPRSAGQCCARPGHNVMSSRFPNVLICLGTQTIFGTRYN